MQGHKIYKKLTWLNELPFEEAEFVFRECGGSSQWARRMADARPFPMLEQLFTAAETIWHSLPPGERTVNFADVEALLEKVLERR